MVGQIVHKISGHLIGVDRLNDPLGQLLLNHGAVLV